jgi:hypothetical protein
LRRRRARTIALVSLVAAALGSERLAAAEPNGIPVALSFEGCPEPLAVEVERIARIELHAAAESGRTTTRIALACVEDDARITIQDPLTGKRVERTVSLATVTPRDRPRLLALALAELARSSWIELETNPTPVLPVPERVEAPPAQKEEARVVAVASRTRAAGLWRGDATIEGMVMPSVGSLIGGVSLGVSRELAASPFFVGGSVAGWEGSADRASGSVTVRQLTLDLGAGFRSSRFEVALGARVGWASLSGAASAADFRGDTVSGVVAGPELAASAGIVGPLRVWLRSGWLLERVRGAVTDDDDVTAGGFHASLGVGLRLGP